MPSMLLYSLADLTFASWSSLFLLFIAICKAESIFSELLKSACWSKAPILFGLIPKAFTTSRTSFIWFVSLPLKALLETSISVAPQ